MPLSVVGSGGGAAPIKGLTSDGAATGGIIVAGDEQVGGTLNIGDLTNAPDPNYPLQLGPGGNTFFVGSNGNFGGSGAVSGTYVVTSGGPSVLRSISTGVIPAGITTPATTTAHADALNVLNGANLHARIDGALNFRTDAGLGVYGHAAPAAQPVLAVGGGATVDDVITLLQSYGLCKQA